MDACLIVLQVFRGIGAIIKINILKGKGMRLFGVRLFGCNHDWKIEEWSNVLQQDDMGYPLRLFICKCRKCGKYDQQWIDVAEEALKELETDKSVLLKWHKIER